MRKGYFNVHLSNTVKLTGPIKIQNGPIISTKNESEDKEDNNS